MWNVFPNFWNNYSFPLSESEQPTKSKLFPLSWRHLLESMKKISQFMLDCFGFHFLSNVLVV